jgi:hypothetical protein
MGVMVDLYCASYPAPPVAVTLDSDDTLDVVHGHQQLSFFNAHYVPDARWSQSDINAKRAMLLIRTERGDT